MSERRDRKDWSERRPAEGVRIIRADEAQAALDAGEAAGRRPDDQPRFGDVPPAPSGPRPAHRFPLPDSVDPAEAVPRPSLAVPVHAEERDHGKRYTPPDRGWAPEPPEPPAPPVSWDLGDRTTELDLLHAERSPAVTPKPLPEDRLWAEDEDDRARDVRPPSPAPPAQPEEGLTVSGGGTDLPHWSDPPTGEVPRIFAGEGPESDDDDLAAWQALGTRGTRWRDSGGDWDDVDELRDLAGEGTPSGILDQSRSDRSDLYSFDEDFERVEAERTGSGQLADFADDPEPPPTRVRSGVTSASRHRQARTAPRRVSDRPAGSPRGTSGGDDLPSRVVVGIGLLVVLAIAYAIGPKALVVLVTVIVVAAAAEAYGVLQRSGFRPATLLGLIATAGLVLGAYWKGVEALPLATVLVFGGAMMWYLLRIVEARPLANVAVTTMTFVWVAVLGSFGALMLRAHHGKGIFLGAVVVAVAADVVAFLVGRWIGNRPMAPSISPSKTVEGFLGGLFAALVVGAIIGKELTPWGGMKHGLLLGLVIGLVAPAGDLFESMVKRDLGVKDSGTVLPGHGGLLDRFDSMLLVLPAAYYVATLFSIVR